mgnify:CR=1 FL=1
MESTEKTANERLQNFSGFIWRSFSEVYVRFRGGDSAAGGAGEESQLNEVGLVDVFDRLAFLARCGGYRLDADGTAAELVDHGREDMSVGRFESEAVDFEEGERFFRDRFRDGGGIF